MLMAPERAEKLFGDLACRAIGEPASALSRLFGHAEQTIGGGTRLVAAEFDAADRSARVLITDSNALPDGIRICIGKGP